MPDETYPIEFDRAGAQTLLGILARSFAYIEARVGEVPSGTIEGNLALIEEPRPRPRPGPYYLSNCEPRLFDEHGDTATSAAVARLAPYLVALLAALESQAAIPPRLAEIPGALPRPA